ncbi:MAG: prohibitin family protein [Bacteroidetes bacterium]|nr:prohibitin family protein [Bacteroidota bacterium]MBU1423703.1 prohibitin family protein [Bacteroidota bacterium]MBU2472374.1 prohibitin family protein [Bacteroidota bacterium]
MLFILLLIVGVVAFFTWKTARKKFMAEGNKAYQSSSGIAITITIIAFALAVTQVFTVIPAGHVGVVDFLGNVSETTLKAGVNMVNPMARVIKMSIKTQEIKEAMNVPSKEGLTVGLEISALFHLNPDKAAEVYKTVGENYVGIILEPQFRSVTRGVTAGYDAKALYTSERELLAMQISNELQAQVVGRGITIEKTPLRQIVLPTGLTAAIEEKLRMEQESQRMQWVLQKEKQEAERKAIEAQGISNFQKIVARGISEPLLRWKGIEATIKIAESNNSKIVIIGSGKDGLPIILDTK